MGNPKQTGRKRPNQHNRKKMQPQNGKPENTQ